MICSAHIWFAFPLQGHSRRVSFSSCSKHQPVRIFFHMVVAVVEALAISAVGGPGGEGDGSGLGWVVGESGVCCVIGAWGGACAACTDGGSGVVAARLKGKNGVGCW